MSNLSTFAIAAITLGSVCFGGLLGVLLRALLPKSHLSKATQESIKSAAGLMATLIALVIGLLVSSAKATFDATSNSISQVGTKVIALDRTLGRYGSETKSIRDQLRKTIETSVVKLTPSDTVHADEDIVMAVAADIEAVRDQIRYLTPRTETQRQLQTQAISLSDEELNTLLQLLEQSQNDLPTLFILILIAWLTVLFVSFGILAPANATAYSTLLVCAVSISFAVFLILELNRPLQGAIQVSTAPLHKAVGVMGK